MKDDIKIIKILKFLDEMEEKQPKNLKHPYQQGYRMAIIQVRGLLLDEMWKI